MRLYPRAIHDDRIRDYLSAVRLLAGADYEAGETLLGNLEFQFRLSASRERLCVVRPGGWLLLDFGQELHGGVRLLTHCAGHIRLRFGESASEAMGAPNQDHAIHDAELLLPRYGMLDYGNTAFRFVRIDSLETTEEIELLNVLAVAVYRDLDWTGSFSCSDERLNRIWHTGAYTVLLNMQDYIYDGAKRDRLVWMGDLHPEVRTILSVFQDHSLVRKTLDYLKDHTALPGWMNGIASYSLWFVITQKDYFEHTGDVEYLQAQWPYIEELMDDLAGLIAADGSERLPAPRLLDWPNYDNPARTHAGLQGLMVWGFAAARKIADYLAEDTEKLDRALAKLQRHVPDCGNCKAAAAMQTLSGLANRTAVLLKNPFSGISTFYGGYMLCAQPTLNALELIRHYWGGMIDFGATTFWEDFDLSWLKDSSPISELPQLGKKDLHADFGNHCYKGLRHSLCHGWASGPTSFLSQRVLGVRFLKPGGRKITVMPSLGNLEYVKGSYPTPQGIITVEADASGRVKVDAPADVEVVSEHDRKAMEKAV